MLEVDEKQDDSVRPNPSAQAEPSSEKRTIPPEGGLPGWLSIVGCTLGVFCTFGFLNAVGVFQTYYETTLLSDYSPSTISWIFAVQLCLMWLPGPLFGRILDTYGPRPLLIPSSILCVFSLCMTSLSTQYYQIILSQGIGFGLGAGGVFATAVVCAGQWFEKRQRGLALGIATSGSSLGGVIFPFFVNKVMESIGFDGTLRYTALFIGVCLTIACFLTTARLPPKPWNNESKWVDFTLFKDKSFAFYTLGAYFVMWGLWAPLDYLSLMALDTSGFSPDLALYLISIVNAGSMPGRIIPGWLADKFGFFNMMVIISSMTGITVLTLWIPFDYHPSHTGLIIFALVYGFVSGGFVSLLMPCAAKSGDLRTLGQRFGTFQLVIALSILTSLPIQGAILTKEGTYLGLQLFAAVSMLIGALLITFARIALVGTLIFLKT